MRVMIRISIGFFFPVVPESESLNVIENSATRNTGQIGRRKDSICDVLTIEDSASRIVSIREAESGPDNLIVELLEL
jgi:hypothetical protein